MPGGSYVLLCGSGLRDTVGMRFCGDVAFRILSVIQVRTTLGCRTLSISKIIVAGGAPELSAPQARPSTPDLTGAPENTDRRR